MYSLLLRKKGWILILAVLMAACLLPLGIYAEANAGAFKDVDRDGWYYDDLNYSVENGLIKGMSETRFAPADKVTRAQYVTILGRIEGSSAVPSQKVSDVGTNHFAYDYVTWAIEKGITNGVGISDKGIRFDPNGNMTREQLAVFTMRYLRSKGIDPSNLPQDQGLYLNDARDISDWAFKDMFYFHRAGLVVGENGDHLGPVRPPRRGVAAQCGVFLGGQLQPFHVLGSAAATGVDRKVNVLRKPIRGFERLIQCRATFEESRQPGFLLLCQFPKHQHNVIVLFQDVRPVSGPFVDLFQYNPERIFILMKFQILSSFRLAVWASRMIVFRL